MKIERLDIKHFGHLQDFSLVFDERLTIIEGANESGKSTIASFICYMLYGFAETDEQTKRERILHMPWQGDTIAGSMYIVVDNKRYSINRSTQSITKGDTTSYAEKASIIDLEQDKPLPGNQSAGERFLGVPFSLYKQTAFLGQKSDIMVHADMRQSIENILFSGSERLNTKKAIALLSGTKNALSHDSGRGMITDIKRQNEELKERLDAAIIEEKAILQKQAKLLAIKRKKQASFEEEERFIQLESDSKSAMLIEAYDRLREEEKAMQEADKRYKNFRQEKSYEHFVPDEAYLEHLQIAEQAYSEAQTLLEEKNMQYQKESAKKPEDTEYLELLEHVNTLGGIAHLTDASSVFLRRHKKKSVCSFVFFLFALSAFSAVVTFILTSGMFSIILWLSIAGLGLLASSIAFLVFAISSRKKAKAIFLSVGAENFGEMKKRFSAVILAEEKEKKRLLALSLAEENCQQAEREAQKKQKALEDNLAMWGEKLKRFDEGQVTQATPLTSGETQAETQVEIKAETHAEMLSETFVIDETQEQAQQEEQVETETEIEIEIESKTQESKQKVDLGEVYERIRCFLAEEKDLLAVYTEAEEKVKKLRYHLKDKSEIAVRAAILPGERERLIKLNHEDLIRGIKHYRKEGKALAQQQEELENALLAQRSSLDAPIVLREKINENEKKIEELQVKYQALTLALETLESSSDRLRQEITPRLMQDATKIFDEITEGKYRDIMFDDQMKIFFGSQDEKHHSAFFSGGTQDAVYFSLRLALVLLLYVSMPPFCLDETLAFQDNQRAKGMLRAVKAYTKYGHQCILLTCHDRESILAREIFEDFTLISLPNATE